MSVKAIGTPLPFLVPLFMKIFLCRYKGELLDSNALSQAVADDKVNANFRNLVSWISNEIGGLGNLDERVSLFFFHH